MIVTGWSMGSPNLRTGTGFGVRLSVADRDQQFCRSWHSLTVLLEGGAGIQVNISPSFWRGCSELRSKEIGRWMLDRGLAPWAQGRPPRLELSVVRDSVLRLSAAKASTVEVACAGP